MVQIFNGRIVHYNNKKSFLCTDMELHRKQVIKHSLLPFVQKKGKNHIPVAAYIDRGGLWKDTQGMGNTNCLYVGKWSLGTRLTDFSL